MKPDIIFIFQWWIYLFFIGLVFWPFTSQLFSRFHDKGYIFSKTIGIAVLSYLVFVFGLFSILSFQRIWIIAILLFITAGAILYSKKKKLKLPDKKILYIIIFEEILFLVALVFWSYIKTFQPDIHGLEKFMDFGFINSILRADSFPPKDIWFSPEPINYYYFGHLVTATLTKLSQIPSFISYNLMIATIFAFTIVSSFSIVFNITFDALKKIRTSILAGILGGLLVSLSGNLHTIYSFFTPYQNENPVPLWDLTFNPSGFPNSYWYPNATRFIPFTIHEFPSYSFVVSDLHAHFLDIPFVLLTIALLYILFRQKLSKKLILIFSFLLAIMYMTNAWDGIIYFGLLSIVILVMSFKKFISRQKTKLIEWKSYFLYVSKHIVLVILGYIIFALPFSLNFKPFASGIGVLCAPSFLTKLGGFGPLLFEIDHCQRSPWWQLLFLYGFFLIIVLLFITYLIKKRRKGVSKEQLFILILIGFSTLLIFIPEFIYAKDIYPGHYRANTMFKLGYEAFIMLSISSAFIITYLLNKWKRYVLLPIFLVLLFFVFLYPYFSISSYFGQLKVQKSLDGISYLKTLYPSDYKAILWINDNIDGQPVMLESQGDSYTDYGRISANTGLPTVLGWTVHEWLWRGDYSIPESRIDDVRALYEDDIETTKSLIEKYNIEFVYLGELEREKYTNINETKFAQLGTTIYENAKVKIYKLKKF